MRRRFYFHYNRQRKGMTVHYRGRCIPCQNVICHPPCESKWNKRQPRLVMQGWARAVAVSKDGIAEIH